ncbi:hypothetical protein F6455_07595 [Proteobacteria bacterium 005FR1]|nr:hypothetical protein [Proteobacteria bacterium 005FR1]
MKRLFALTICSLLLASPVLAKGDDGRGLPPGLAKKQQSGQALPPGWQKKLSKGDVLEESIYMQGRVVVPLGRDGSISIEVDGTLLRLHEKTREILDILS